MEYPDKRHENTGEEYSDANVLHGALNLGLDVNKTCMTGDALAKVKTHKEETSGADT